jgi:hypothetical protein
MHARLGGKLWGAVARGLLEARARLDRVEGDGWYVTERRRFFDLLAHFSSADDLLEFQVREGYSGEAPTELIASANRLLASGGGELVVREPIRASVLKRLPQQGITRRSDGN